MTSGTEDAARRLVQARDHRERAPSNCHDYEDGTRKYHRETAERLEREAMDLLTEGEHRQLVPEGEVSKEVLPIAADKRVSGGGNVPLVIKETLEKPARTSIDASTHRLDLLFQTGVLELGLDAARSIGAQNSLEKMLVHQMAWCHDLAMKLSARAMKEDDPAESVRLLNVAARFMRTYQEGLLALQKFRNGGHQVVTVQHVTVRDGGQAVVAGQVGGGGDRGGRQNA